MKKRARLILRLLPVVVMAGALALLYVKSPYVRGHLHVFSPRIVCRVEVRDGERENEYRFTGVEGHGKYRWTAGTDEAPIGISLFNTNDWHVISIDLEAEHIGGEWIVSGASHLDGDKEQPISCTAPYGEFAELRFEDGSFLGAAIGAECRRHGVCRPLTADCKKQVKC